VVHELEVEVGLGGVAGVAALGQGLAGGHPVAGPDPDRAPAQVGQGGVDPAAQVEDEVVAEDPPRPQQLADRALGHQESMASGEVRLQWSRSRSWARTTVASAGARTGRPNPGKSSGRRARGHQASPGRGRPAGSWTRSMA